MRRRIEEIVTLYQLEPSTRQDVYVEGGHDKEFLDWLFRLAGIRGRSVFEINQVDVPSAVVDEAGLPQGSNRSRVIALALKIWQEIPREECLLVFIVDKDLAPFFEPYLIPDGVRATDYSSMDAYLLTPEALERFLCFACKAPREKVEGLAEDVFSAAHSIFAVRVAKEKLGLGIRTLDVEGQLRSDGGRIRFDRGQFVHRTLNRAAMLRRIEEVTAEVEATVAQIAAQGVDRVGFCNGHDLMAILGEAVHLIAKDSAYREEARVRTSLLMALDVDALARFPLLAELLGRVEPRLQHGSHKPRNLCKPA